jgi:hypothetical protein
VPLKRSALAWRLLAGLLLAALAVTAGRLLWLRLSERYPIVRFERSRYVQQLVTLRSYEARGAQGSFLPTGHAQLAIRESMLQNVLARSLPIRQSFEEGRYQARLDRAQLELDDGLAAITLEGRGVMLGPDASPLEAELRIQAHIDVVEYRPDPGTLRATLSVTAFRVMRAGSRARPNFLNPVVRYFAGLRAEDWNRERPTLDIPVRLEREVTLPMLTGDFLVDSTRLAVAVRVAALTVFQDRLVLSLALEREGEDRSSAAAVEDWVAPPLESRERMEQAALRLYREGRGIAARDAIRDRVANLADGDSLWQGLVDSDRDVVAVVPHSILQRLCRRLAGGYLRTARVDFDPDLREELDEQIRARVLGIRVGAGRVKGSLSVTRLRGRVRVHGEPVVRLLPPDQLELTVPVQVVEGEGRVRAAVAWDPAFLVAAVCRGFEFEENLAGEVVPFSHSLRTRIRFSVEGPLMRGRPIVRRDRVHVPWELTPVSREKLRAALSDQDKFLRCGMAMNPDSVLLRIERLLRDKVSVNLPGTLFGPFVLPVALRQEVDAGEFRIISSVRDPEVAVRPGYLRFGFRADLAVRPIPGAAKTTERDRPGGSGREGKPGG